MKFSILNKIVCLTLIFISTHSFGQNIILSENAKVSVITCDTGNESYSLFGHTAVRIADTSNNLDAVFNFGAFDFATPNFVAKFAKGDLQYFAVANSFSNFLNQYTYEKRSVFEQELNIPLIYKQKLLDNLTSTLSSSESYYTYKFIDKNCTSMVVDLLNKTLGSKIITKKTDTNITYRSILFPYFDNSFYEKLGTSIIFGSKVDAFGTKIFLPLELHKSLAQIHYNNQALAKESKTILEFEKEVPSSWWNSIYSYLLILVLLVIIRTNKKYPIYFGLMGILGIFFAFMGFYSLHQELANNYNVLLFNPTLIFLAYFLIKKKNKWIVNFAVFNILSIAVYLVFMLNKAHLFIMLPLMITSVILLSKTAYNYSKRIPIVF